MVKLPKSIIAKYGITKKAWQVFRGTKKGKARAKAAPKKHTRHARPKKARARKSVRRPSGEIQTKGVHKMARKRKRGGLRRRARRVVGRVRAGMDTRPGKMLAMAAEATGGAILSSMIVNKAPMIKDQTTTAKSLLQGGIGLAAVMLVKNRHVKSLGAGAIIAAVMGVARDVLKVNPLSGPSAGSARLSPSEMARLTNGQMGLPLRDRMGVPLSTAPANAGFPRAGFGS